MLEGVLGLGPQRLHIENVLRAVPGWGAVVELLASQQVLCMNKYMGLRAMDSSRIRATLELRPLLDPHTGLEQGPVVSGASDL